MISLEIASHRLQVNQTFPHIRQQERNLRYERQQTIIIDVDKLLVDGFIHEVMIKKKHWKVKEVRGFYQLKQGMPK
jgi:hypothetical protein